MNGDELVVDLDAVVDLCLDMWEQQSDADAVC
jgi:hypothetical protein